MNPPIPAPYRSEFPKYINNLIQGFYQEVQKPENMYFIHFYVPAQENCPYVMSINYKINNNVEHCIHPADIGFNYI